MTQGSLVIEGTRCAIGGERLATTITGRQPCGDGYACSDHYFAALGKLVEASPIRAARIRRG